MWIGFSSVETDSTGQSPGRSWLLPIYLYSISPVRFDSKNSYGL